MYLAGITCFVIFFSVFFLFTQRSSSQTPSLSQSEPGFEEAEDSIPNIFIHPRIRGLENWERAPGPVRVALQAGHMHAEQAPDEQENLRKNTGASAAGTTERDVNIKIAEETKKILENNNIIVDILPTTIPMNYSADAFVAIHADGNLDTTASGYKVAAPRRDFSGQAENFAKIMEQTYEQATGLKKDPNITRNMRGYYAFNWRRYDHSLHPMTPGVIIETGFLTNPGDRRIIVSSPEKSAKGIANGIVQFLISSKILSASTTIFSSSNIVE